MVKQKQKKKKFNAKNIYNDGKKKILKKKKNTKKEWKFVKHKKERRELKKKKKVTQNVPEYMVAFYFLFPCFQSWVLLKFER